MTTLARKLHSRNHDVVFISGPDGEPSVRAADLAFLPYAVKEIAAGPLKERPRWLKLQVEEALRGCTTECSRQDRSDVEFIARDANCSRGRCSRN
jgi:hypothetical protein